jgi:hypothetical protein
VDATYYTLPTEQTAAAWAARLAVILGLAVFVVLVGARLASGACDARTRRDPVI